LFPTLEELLTECEGLHGHICPGQVLGVRMALLGCRLAGIDDPRGADRKRLLVWVEIDRCLADAVGAVTGTRLGRRSLKFFDYGKVAATFLNLETGRAFRLVALESSRGLAEMRYPHLATKKERQMRAYTEAADEELFSSREVSVRLLEQDLPGRPKSRAVCTLCGETVNDGREVTQADGRVACKPCSHGGYYQTPRNASDNV
jgi:formylmethanofuran dehydrogenase subunit E